MHRKLIDKKGAEEVGHGHRSEQGSIEIYMRTEDVVVRNVTTPAQAKKEIVDVGAIGIIQLNSVMVIGRETVIADAIMMKITKTATRNITQCLGHLHVTKADIVAELNFSKYIFDCSKKYKALYYLNIS